MRSQGLQALTRQIKVGFASIRTGFALGCAYDAGSVTWRQTRAVLTGEPAERLSASERTDRAARAAA